MRPCFTSGLLSASLLLTATVLTPAAAQSFNQAIVFGDSNVATGWVGIGYLVNSQILASFFGLTANSANQPGGTNYAIGGALDAAVPANGNRGNLGNPSLPSTVQQITNYLASTAGVANPNAIYLVSSGSNDSAFAVGAFGTLTAQQNYLSSQATNLITAIKRLQSAGAQYIIVQNGLVSRPLANFYNQTLWTNLAAAGVAFIPADRLAMVKAVQSNPTMFGFTAATVVQATIGSGTSNTASACIYNGPGFATMGSWSQICLDSATPSTSFAYLRTANAQQTSFFADDAHFSAAGQKIEADYMYNLVTAPSEISYLAEAPVKTRAAVVAAIDSQIAISQSQSGPTPFPWTVEVLGSGYTI
jgi:outer membrane lipase/esterase